MDILNSSTVSNNSAFVPNILNDSSEITRNITSQKVLYHSYVLLCTFLLGLPGNVLVIVVYVANMKTSTRVYMFALALADTVICVSGIVIALPFYSATTPLIILRMMIKLSILILVFVSIERLIAVRTPHSFNVNPTRAKIYIIVFLLCAIALTIMEIFARRIQYLHVVTIVKASVLVASAVIMITCYTLIGVTLLKKAIESRKKIAGNKIVSYTQNSNPSNTTLTFVSAHDDVVQAPQITAVSHNSAKQSNNVKRIFLLFVITVVFVICWMPTWLRNLGVNVPRNVQLVYVANSVVNPFIYGVASAMFREDVRQFYRQTRTKLSACYT